MADQPGGTISTATVARLLMLSSPRINQLTKDGWIERVAPGQYSLVAAVQGYIRFLRDDTKRSSRIKQQTKISEAKARAIELRTLREERKVADIEEAVAFVDEGLARIKTECDGIGARCTARSPTWARDAALRQAIDDEFAEAFRRALGGFEQASVVLRAGEDAMAYSPEDNA